MIPKFPQFKKLKFRDKKDIERITHKFAPYSDFNFISMWSWNTKNEMLISQIHGNLVVRFTDYITSKPFYSFLGNHEVNKTVKALLELSKKEGLEFKLKLVSEDSIKGIDTTKYKVEEDRDNFDYIYNNEDLSNLLGSKFKDKRYLVNKFEINNLNYKFILNKKLEIDVIKDMLELDKDWAKSKAEKDTGFDISSEVLAVKRFFLISDRLPHSNFLFFCLYVEKKMVGFFINSLINKDYTLCHFAKGDTKYVGVYEFMFKNYAKNIIKISNFINYEQDLGIPSLRFSKKSFNPTLFLKKYVIIKA